MALCLFPLFSGIGIYFGFKGAALFAFGCAAGLLAHAVRPCKSALRSDVSLRAHARRAFLCVRLPVRGTRAPSQRHALGRKGRHIGFRIRRLPFLRYCSYTGALRPARFLRSGRAKPAHTAALPKVKFYTSIVVLFAYCAIAAFPSSLIRASVMSPLQPICGRCRQTV